MSLDFSFNLSPASVDIWLVKIVGTDSIVHRFQEILAPDEMSRAGRFKSRQLRERYILSRGSLRVLLARYLDVAPATLRFRYGAKGKPELAEPMGVEFNISHSGDLAAFAFSISGPIGIDVEQIHFLPDMEMIAKEFFSVNECDELMRLPHRQREHAFFLCWTRKEAYIKAVGDGLHIPLNSFSVTLHPDHPAEVVGLPDDREAATAWKLHGLKVGPAYAGALAYFGIRRKVIVHSCIQASDGWQFLSEQAIPGRKADP